MVPDWKVISHTFSALMHLSRRCALDNTCVTKDYSLKSLCWTCVFFVQKGWRAGQPPRRAVYCQEGWHLVLSNMEDRHSSRGGAWRGGDCRRCVFVDLISGSSYTKLSNEFVLLKSLSTIKQYNGLSVLLCPAFSWEATKHCIIVVGYMMLSSQLVKSV